MCRGRKGSLKKKICFGSNIQYVHLNIFCNNFLKSFINVELNFLGYSVIFGWNGGTVGPVNKHLLGKYTKA